MKLKSTKKNHLLAIMTESPMKKLFYSAMIMVVVAISMSTMGCKTENIIQAPAMQHRELPNFLSSATNIDTINATCTLPLYRGKDASGGDVYYCITE